MFALLLAGSLAVLTVPTLANAAEDMDDINAGMGQLSQRVGAVEKILGFKLGGDMRFREEYFMQDQDNKPTGAITAGISDRNRVRVRLRFGGERAWGDSVKVGFRLATGVGTDITSTNQTLTGDFQLKPILVDRAYITWAPSLFENKIKFEMGKIANPITKSPINWDDDVNPEGVAFTAEPIAGSRLRACYWSTRENSTNKDAFFYNVQLEQSFKPVSDVDCLFAVGYQYVPYINAYLKTPPAGESIGGAAGVDLAGMVVNAAAAGKMPEPHIVDGILTVKYKMGDVPFAWTLHGCYNLDSFNINPLTVPAVAVVNPTSNASNALAMFAQVAVGKVATGGDWAGSLEFGYIEPNAVFGYYSDSDSGVGFNNNVWLKGVAEVGLEEGLSFKLGQYAVWRQNYDVFGNTPNATLGGTSHAPVFRTQADFVAKL